MLYFKAWRESRVRFVLSALTLAGLCAAFVYYQSAARIVEVQKLTYDSYIWKAIYKGYLRELYVLLVLFLGVGGLLRERDYGTAGFTLALPVSRWRHLMARATIGLAEVAALAALPALLIPPISRLIGQTYPWHQSWRFALLWSVCGAAVFSGAFVCSELLAGEYTAPIAAFIVLLAYSLIGSLGSVERYVPNLHDVMSGNEMAYFNAAAGLFTGAFPWKTLVLIGAVSIGLLLLSAVPTNQREF
jgi:ABC-type transport system involved in multi-copper enzyme maturation permease subunit